MNERITLRLTLEVTYDTNGTSVQVLKDNLFNIVDRAFGEGQITGAWEAEVVTHEATVKKV